MKRLLFVTHENLEQTPVARAMMYDVAVGLRDEYATGIISASSEETLERKDEMIEHFTFKRLNDKRISARDLAAFIIFFCRNISLVRNCDIAFARSYPSMLVLVLLQSLHRRPIIFDTRGLFFHELFDSGVLKSRFFKPLLFMIERWLLRQASKVICVTEGQASYYRDQGCASKKLHVIYNCAQQVAGEVPRAKTEKKHVIGYVGSLGRWHMPEFLVEVLSEVQALHDDFEFHCVTPEVKKAEEIFKRITDKSIYSHPYREHPIRFDLGICLIEDSFSKSVCFPVKLCEYISAQTPVLFSNNVEVCNIIHQSQNIGLPIGSNEPASAVAGKIVAFLNDAPPNVKRLPSTLTFESQLNQIKEVLALVVHEGSTPKRRTE